MKSESCGQGGKVQVIWHSQVLGWENASSLIKLCYLKDITKVEFLQFYEIFIIRLTDY